MFSRILVTALLAALGLPALCQQPQTSQTARTTQAAAPLPDYAVYGAFLYRVKWLSDLADKYASRGKAPSAAYFRSLVQMQAGLTDQEGAALKAIAADWRAGDSGIVSTSQALVKAGAAANAVQLQALAVQRQQLVTTHISQLQAALGPARFQVLDSFVHALPTLKGATTAPAPK
ncbi:MAG: hypothetical protein ABSF25_08595 [Bryobacteraceae bacterium]|jgi:hypothetical protein